MTSSEILRAAAEYIRVHGWTKGKAEDDAGRVCMTGAISCVSSLTVPQRWRLYKYLHATLSVHPIDFNDRCCETADDAIAALEIAADLATP